MLWAIRGHQGVSGCRGISSAFGDWQIGASGDIWGLLGGGGVVGLLGRHQGVSGCRGISSVLGLVGSVGTQGPEGV